MTQNKMSRCKNICTICQQTSPKVGLETWLWRQIVTSETAHTKYKWPPYAIEWIPPMKIFCIRHWRYVSVLSNIIPRYWAHRQKGRISSLKMIFSSRLASLLRWKTADNVFVVLNFNLQVWSCLPIVAMWLLTLLPLIIHCFCVLCIFSATELFWWWWWWWCILSADTKSIVQTHTFCSPQVDKNVHNRRFYNGIGGWLTGLQTFTSQNVLQRRWRPNHSFTDTLLTLLFANP